MPLDRDVLTTGEVAKICNVAPRTVSKWFDNGLLKGYRIPGSKDRRIPMSELTRFMKASGIPMDNVPSTGTRVLVVDPDSEVVDVLGRVLAERDEYEVRTATTAFQAGLEVERFQPHSLLIDIHIGGGDGREIAALVRESEAGRLTRIIAMSGRLTGGQAHSLQADGFDTILKKPFQVRQVLEAIEGAASLAA